MVRSLISWSPVLLSHLAATASETSTYVGIPCATTVHIRVQDFLYE